MEHESDVMKPEGDEPLHCPSCHKTLTLMLDEGAPIHGCGQCKGVWVELVDEKTLLRIKPAVFSVDELRRLRKLYQPIMKDDPVRLRACPECGELMYRRNWGGHSGVVVDRCERHGTWYDEGEIEKVREYIQLGGIEFEKLRLAEKGLSGLETKLDQKAAELDLRTIHAYRRARLWSFIGF